MAEDLKPVLEEILKEQKKTTAEQERTSLYTLTLERDRLVASLMQAGLIIPVMTANEFSLAAGATTTIVQLVPPGFVYIYVGMATWYTSLPWWCSYSMWADQTAPAIPLWTALRMPDQLSTPDFGGLAGFRAFAIHQVTNNHATEHAYGLIQNTFVGVTVETWDMIRAVYIDPIVADVRRKALETSGIQR